MLSFTPQPQNGRYTQETHGVWQKKPSPSHSIRLCFLHTNESHMKTTILKHHSTRKILAAALVFLSGALTDFAATVESSRPRPREKAASGTCNLPPVPAPGQTVIWTLAGSPYEICQTITIPATSTVIVEAGVQINFDPDMQVLVSGTMDLQGQSAQRIVLQAPAVFPPIVGIDGGVFDASFSDFNGQVRVENGANVAFLDSRFLTNNGVLWAQELPTTRPFIRIERCTFDSSSSAFITDGIAVLRDNVFNNAICSLLRGFVDVTATNTFTNTNFSVTREESVQPFYINGVHATNGSRQDWSFRVGIISSALTLFFRTILILWRF